MQKEAMRLLHKKALKFVQKRDKEEKTTIFIEI